VISHIQQKASRMKNWKRRYKLTQELKLIHRRRPNLRREILEKARLHLGEELTKLRIDFVGLEAALERDSKDKKGGLAKAITSMPDNIQLVAKEILALNQANPFKTRLAKENTRNKEMGIIKPENWLGIRRIY